MRDQMSFTKHKCEGSHANTSAAVLWGLVNDERFIEPDYGVLGSGLTNDLGVAYLISPHNCAAASNLLRGERINCTSRCRRILDKGNGRMERHTEFVPGGNAIQLYGHQTWGLSSPTSSEDFVVDSAGCPSVRTGVGAVGGCTA